MSSTIQVSLGVLARSLIGHIVPQISSSHVGRLIGRGGECIKEIRMASACRINIGEEGQHETDVVLSGTDEQRRDAERLIYKHLGYSMPKEEAEDNNNDGRGQDKEDELIDWKAVKADYEKAQKEKWAKCPKLIKTFYQEHPEVKAMSEEQVEAFRKDNNNIVVSNFDDKCTETLMNPCPEFYHSWHNFPDVMATIEKQGFKKPSPIQAQAWPYLLAGKDLIGIAQTGTGKTLAFLLPAFVHIEGQPVPRGQRGGPNVLVMSPTRELALQIAEEVRKYEYHGIKSVCVYGGGDRRLQMKVVTEGVEIIIATPGRLNDLIEAGCIAVESVTYLVLDEADRMLDMGFEPQIRKILLDIRPDRQTIMTSATWPPGVRRLATTYMSNPVTVFIGTLDLAAVHSVTQQILFVEDDDEKRMRLMEFFEAMDPDDKVIVFVGKKSRADDIASDLSLRGVVCQSIHGDREQSDREQALQDLRSGEVSAFTSILVDDVFPLAGAHLDRDGRGQPRHRHSGHHLRLQL